MKNLFVIFRFVLAYLMAISIAGCSGDPVTEEQEPTLMEQLTGEYVLVEFEFTLDGVTISLEPPVVFGELTLEVGGKSFSRTMVITPTMAIMGDDEGTSRIISESNGNYWVADPTILRMKGSNDLVSTRFEYTWDGKYLTLKDVTTEGIDTTKWQKL